MKTTRKFSALLICLIFAAACTYDFPESQKPTSGEADFTKMVSVGNSITAGFMNGAVYTASQNNSFVATLAAQMALVGGGTFNQATIGSDNGCFNAGGGCTQGRLYLKIVGGSPVPTPKPGHGSTALFAPLSVADRNALNNFGVPGATIGSAQSAALSANPYYGKIASNAGTSTLIGDASAALDNGGTFFTFWLGNNDVLGYATSGAAAGAPTDPTVFETQFNAALDAMMDGNDAKGAVANIPDVTTIPFFTTVPYNPVTLVQAQVDQLNPGYATYNGGLDAAFGGGAISAAERDARKIVFVVGKNPVTIVDEKLTDLSGMGLPSYRFATTHDLVVLPAASFIGTTVGGDPTKVNGISVPLADQWIVGGLDGAWVTTFPEKEEILTAITNFNASISEAVEANSDRLVLVNANAALSLIRNTAVTINGSALTAAITPPNGAFSLDGVHPNARGSAYIANEFIKAINGKFGSTIPLCNPNSFGGNELPVP